MIDFEVPKDLQELAERVDAFVREVVIPFEGDPRVTAHGPTDDLRREMNALARKEGLLAPHVGTDWGGLGLSHTQKAVVFEAAGYSILGPVALHIAAPDEGNMHLLEVVGSPEQKQRYLGPLASGETRSCFCMTEPGPGAGSDPGALATTAVREGDEFVITGRKWLITGADGAAFAIIMARTEEEGEAGATMFLSPMDADGIRIERTLDTLDRSFTGGHVVMSFDGLRVPESAVLGAVGKGFQYAQVRLAPARLTHCMRWLGAARRANDIAVEHARTREAFGKPIGEHEGIGFMLADNAMDLHVARLTIWHTAWVLDQGHRGTAESSMAKVVVSEALGRIADRCVQVLGGLGTTRDTMVEHFFREARSFRIYDGPSEVHRWSLARRALRRQKP